MRLMKEMNFYVVFFRNQFGRVNDSTIFGQLASDVARPGEITYVNIPIGFVVFDSTTDVMDSLYKGIHIKAEGNRRIVVFGQK